MQRLRSSLEQINTDLFHARGLRILWPRQVGFLFLEIEYYVSDFITLMLFFLTR